MSDDPRAAALAVVRDAYQRDRLPFLALALLGALDGERFQQLMPVAGDPVARILASVPVPSPAYEVQPTRAGGRASKGPVSPVDTWHTIRGDAAPDAESAWSVFARWVESGEPFSPEVLSNG